MKHYKWEDIPKEQVRPGITRQIVSGENMTLGLHEVQVNLELKPHSHPHEQVVLILKGELEYTVGEEKSVIKPGEVLIIPSNVVHYASRVIGKSVLNLDIWSPIRKDYLK
jgi:quercetin dioxygenase-like cupin family protein